MSTRLEQLEIENRELRKQLNELSLTVGEGFVEFRKLIESQDRLTTKLVDVVLDGNGRPSLSARMLILEKENKELRLRVDELVKEKQEEQKEAVRSKWGMSIAIVSGLLGLLAAAIQAIATLFQNGATP